MTQHEAATNLNNLIEKSIIGTALCNGVCGGLPVEERQRFKAILGFLKDARNTLSNSDIL